RDATARLQRSCAGLLRLRRAGYGPGSSTGPGDWKGQGHAGALTRRAGECGLAPGLGCETKDLAQAKATAAAYVLGGEKRLEDTREVLDRNACAGVGYGYIHEAVTTVLRRSGFGDLAQGGGDGNGASRWHRVATVADQVEQRGFELRPVHMDKRQLRGKLVSDGHVIAGATLEQFPIGLDQSVGVHGLGGKVLATT